MPDLTPAVAVMTPDIKPGLRRGRVSLDRLLWPLGRPERLAEGTIGDLAATDHLVGFPQSYYLAWPGLGTRAQVSVVMAEPTAIHGGTQKRVIRAARRYHRILSYNEDLLARVPNGIFFPYGSTWVRDWRTRDMTKHAMCSLIASKKRSQAGHALRHRLVERVRDEGLPVDVMGRGYKPFDTKAEGLAPYRYSLIIENVQERNYFTEKLVDAVLCRTVPIYWGCPNIGDFMDTSGMILCQSEAEMHAALLTMSEEDYATRRPGLEAAIPAAASYGDFYWRAAKAVAEDRPEPPLS
ncbi:glycosyltransferase family 10 domain-containing protein [Roseovarius indicus]|uniref:glycosyltransferase family 10 domain-containing protein n=1 Tax=Roseovarius indicus TaxID=540747 RepID=UPI0007DA3463|nr:glycosyltransferase family 10 [Roseovarius indicus]OAO01551.1 hypothetical protein A8B76_19475 [Roseovarius indicus]